MSKRASDEEIIAALIQGGSITGAADALGISARTIYERMRKPAFQIIYNELRVDLLRESAAALQNRVGQAIETIAGIMESESASPAVRLQAAQMLLQNAMKFGERTLTAEQEADRVRSSLEVDMMLNTGF
jgi:hypothetical protein